MGIRSAAEALAAARSTHSYAHAMCLNFVWTMYGSVPSDLPGLASVSYALQGWNYSQMQHPGDRTPPPGAPVYFTAASGGATAGEGHVCLSTGGEGVISTDINGYGTVGPSTLGTIERAWGRQYLGWTGDCLGWPIDFSGVAGGNAEGIDELTPEQDALLRNIAGFLYAGGTDAGNPNYYGMPGSLYHLVKSPVFRTIDGKVQKIPQIQDNADTNTMVRSLLVQIGALSKVVQSLAAANGADPDTITKLVEKAAHDGAQDAFADLHLGGTVELEPVETADKK